MDTAGIKEELETLTAGRYDVIVAGAGIAGVAASLSAARNGAKTLLIEKGTYAGGLATMGLVAIYLPLCDGCGHQVSFGIAEELLKLSGKYGFSDVPSSWKEGNGRDRYETDFSPAAFAIAIDELLEKEHIDVLYDTLVCGCRMEEMQTSEKRIAGVTVENKSGRSFYACSAAVDTTGDADLLWRAGVPTETGDNGLSYWTYTVSREKLRAMSDGEELNPRLWLNFGGATESGTDSPIIRRRYDGTDAKDVSDFLKDGRKCLRKTFLEDGKGKDNLILTLPAMAQFRTTRHLAGDYCLTEADENAHFEDSVGCIADFRVSGPVWEVPYRSIVRKDHPNLFTAGRSIAASGKAWMKTRVIPGAAVTGQAAGAAAALYVSGTKESLFDVLEKQGAKRHF